MQLIYIINKLQDTDKKLFLNTYNKWNLCLYDKIHELNDNNIKVFIESILDTNIHILEEDLKSKTFNIISKVVSKNYYVTTNYFDDILINCLKELDENN